jgi:alkaline phosphatase D
VEFCGTSITSRSGGNSRVPAWLAGNPHFVFADAERKGYGVAEFTPKQMTVNLCVVDDVTKRETRVETLASFAVEAGRPRVEKT